ncbi:HAF repeat-containing protein [Candidatus Odyssella thessalonicensis]|uniref:HAF repeat-containing protein n=1 Tax=Candidatus Odyssella thessalonicensis TaxID=84647 RepID=UPI000225AEDD|nr:HAF repeat-containing protein [Candidatus Odyssella thessalonicensis]
MPYLVTLITLTFFATWPTINLSAMEGAPSEASFGEQRVIQQTLQESPCEIDILPDEIVMHIFSFLNLKDIFSPTLTCHKWKQLMQDNNLWREYARRAQLLILPGLAGDKNYKELVRANCIPAFAILGSLNKGNDAGVFATNFDGSVIVGTACDKDKSKNTKAFRWTAQEGITFLGESSNQACATNFDGTVIIGSNIVNEASRLVKSSFRWAANEGMVTLRTAKGTLPSYTFAKGTNFDGSVIVGEAEGTAFRWTAQEGILFLGTLNGGNYSNAQATNYDGSIIVGEAVENRQKRAFRWTEQDGMVSLGTLNGGNFSYAHTTNYDGSIVIGCASDGKQQNELRAIRWTAKEGMVSLGTLNGMPKSQAIATNVDGSVIVGEAGKGPNLNQSQAFRWTPGKGMESIQELLSDQDLLPPNCKLIWAGAITPLGTTVVGDAIFDDSDPNAETFIWRAVLPRDNLFNRGY